MRDKNPEVERKQKPDNEKQEDENGQFSARNKKIAEIAIADNVGSEKRIAAVRELLNKQSVRFDFPTECQVFQF